jgi:hypothetical protein
VPGIVPRLSRGRQRQHRCQRQYGGLEQTFHGKTPPRLSVSFDAIGPSDLESIWAFLGSAKIVIGYGTDSK